VPNSIFWAQLKDKPILSKYAENFLLPFPTTYLREAGFSALAVIKSIFINRLDLQHNMRCALSINIFPNVEESEVNGNQNKKHLILQSSNIFPIRELYDVMDDEINRIKALDIKL